MRLPSSKRGPLEVSGHKLEGAPVSRITSFTSHAQLNRHRISTDLDWNTVLPREYDEGKKRKGIKNTYCCSVTQSCPTLCNPMDCGMPGFPGCSDGMGWGGTSTLSVRLWISTFSYHVSNGSCFLDFPFCWSLIHATENYVQSCEFP